MINSSQSNLFDQLNNNDTENDHLTNNQETILPPPLYDTIKINSRNIYYIKKFFQLKDIIINLNPSNEEIKEKNNYLPSWNIKEIELIDDNEIDSVCYSQYESLNIHFVELKKKFINLNKLFNCNKKISKNSYFRFPYIKEKTIYCIPQVIYTEGKISFIYDKEKIDMNIENILELISDRKLFINKNNSQHIFNKAYFGQAHKNKYINICDCHKNICEKCKNEKYICHQELFSKKSIPDNLNHLLYYLTKLSYNSFNIIFCYKNQIKNILKELENENYNEEIKKI